MAHFWEKGQRVRERENEDKKRSTNEKKEKVFKESSDDSDLDRNQ